MKTPAASTQPALLDDLNAEKSLTVELLTRADAEQKLDRSDLTLVFVIPAGFSQTLASGQPAQVIFMQRGNGGQDGQIVASIIRGAVSRLNQDFSVRGQVEQVLAGKGIPPAQIAVTTQNFLDRERQAPLVGITEVALGIKPNLVNEFLPGIITMYVLFSISISAAAIVDERRKGYAGTSPYHAPDDWRAFLGQVAGERLPRLRADPDSPDTFLRRLPHLHANFLC